MQRLHAFLATLRDLFSTEEPERESPGELIHRSVSGPHIKIVALTVSERERDILSRAGASQGWSIQFAETCCQAWDLLHRHGVPIFLCDREFPNTEWRHILHMMSSGPEPVYAILLSRVADDYLWGEVIRHGGHDLLATPLCQADVLRAIRLGWSYWSSSMRLPPMPIKHYL